MGHFEEKMRKKKYVFIKWKKSPHNNKERINFIALCREKKVLF